MLSKKSKMSEPKLVVLLVTDTEHDVRLPMYNLTHIISLISYQRKQAGKATGPYQTAPLTLYRTKKLRSEGSCYFCI